MTTSTNPITGTWPSKVVRKPMTSRSDRLRYVLAGLSFPVNRWELIAFAEHYGADATTLRELHMLPQRRYWSLPDVIGAIAT
jgi:hypothetical protein